MLNLRMALSLVRPDVSNRVEFRKKEYLWTFILLAIRFWILCGNSFICTAIKKVGISSVGQMRNQHVAEKLIFMSKEVVKKFPFLEYNSRRLYFVCHMASNIVLSVVAFSQEGNINMKLCSSGWHFRAHEIRIRTGWNVSDFRPGLSGLKSTVDYCESVFDRTVINRLDYRVIQLWAL